MQTFRTFEILVPIENTDTFEGMMQMVTRSGVSINNRVTTVTLNLAHIVAVSVSEDGKTWIACSNGNTYLSAIEYKFLASSLDERFVLK